MKRSVRGDMMRRAIAEEAARLIIEHGLEDFGIAKRKAAEHFGVTEQSVLPRNTEIEVALADRQRVFGADRHPHELAALRREALDAMHLLAAFDPRLVGPVLSGTATAHSGIDLHVFADSLEAVVLALLDAGVSHKVVERRLRVGSQRDEAVHYPAIRFQTRSHEVEATVFPLVGLRQAPLSPVDGRPMRRATIAEVELLIADSIDQARFASGT